MGRPRPAKTITFPGLIYGWKGAVNAQYGFLCQWRYVCVYYYYFFLQDTRMKYCAYCLYDGYLEIWKFVVSTFLTD